MKITTLPKTVLESRIFLFDFSQQPEIVAGETIVGIVGGNATATPSGELVLSAATVGSGAQAGMVLVTISGGVLNSRYLLKIRVTLSNGAVIEGAGVLSIVAWRLPNV